MTRICLLIISLWYLPTLRAQLPGCTDPLATNYDPSATVNDGSCLYPATALSPAATFALPRSLDETSGLSGVAGALWTHNDDTDTLLYALDTLGQLLQTCPLPGVTNRDWEDLAHDGTYFYLGDVGNNANGGRQDLRILRVAHLCTDSVRVDTIAFTYEDADSLAPGPANQTDYDCEALVATGDSLYLFTKQWLSQGSRAYALPKTPGTWVAQRRDSLPGPGLITGAALLDEARLLLLCGYSTTLQPFLLLCYDYPGRHFFRGNIRRIDLSLAFHQVEAIESADGRSAYLTNERFSQVITTPARLHRLDLSPYTGAYLQGQATALGAPPRNAFRLYPNPAQGQVTLDLAAPGPQPYTLLDGQGRPVREGQLQKGPQALSLEGLSAGTYYLLTPTQKEVLQVRK